LFYSIILIHYFIVTWYVLKNRVHSTTELFIIPYACIWILFVLHETKLLDHKCVYLLFLNSCILCMHNNLTFSVYSVFVEIRYIMVKYYKNNVKNLPKNVHYYFKCRVTIVRRMKSGLGHIYNRAFFSINGGSQTGIQVIQVVQHHSNTYILY